jgi:hypothetical protein
MVGVEAQKGDAMRRSLELVRELKQEPFAANVDSLPEAQRRSLANTNVVVPNRYFSLVIELTKNDFQILESPGSVASPAAADSPPRKRSSSRLPWQQSEDSADTNTSNTKPR